MKNILNYIKTAKAIWIDTKLYFQATVEVFTKSLNWQINLSITLSPFVDKNKVAKFKARDKKQIFLEQETLSSGKAMGSLFTQTSRKQK